MTKEVVVTRRGQTTILQEIRKKLDICEGTRLTVEAEGGKIVFSKVPSIFDVACKSKLNKDETFRLLDKMREEKLVLDTRQDRVRLFDKPVRGLQAYD